MFQQLADQQKVRQAAEAEAARQLAEQQRRRFAEQMVEIKVTEGYSC